MCSQALLEYTKVYIVENSGAKWEKGEIWHGFCLDPYFLPSLFLPTPYAIPFKTH